MNAGTANDDIREHSFSLDRRRSMKLCGVTDAVSFDEQIVILETACGRMEIGGSELHVDVLDLKNGVVELRGRIDSIGYSADDAPKGAKEGFFGRLFR